MTESLSLMPCKTMFQVMVSAKFLNFKENRFAILKKKQETMKPVGINEVDNTSCFIPYDQTRRRLDTSHTSVLECS